MKNFIDSIVAPLVNSILAPLNLRLGRKSSHEELVAQVVKLDKLRDYELSEMISEEHLINYFVNLSCSKSQLRQGLFALSELSFKQGGFFVEFGATNGVGLSNTHLLETKFGWKGILAEPAKLWHT
ncbi:MAG: hypothetical protein GKR96_07435 [Gammaproteobacteria bacterium]|nr:hypothetical protein [Gammaproteobacteria bacterium]